MGERISKFMSNIFSLIYFLTIGCWIQILTSRDNGGHMSGLGEGLLNLASLFIILIQIILALIGGIVYLVL